MKIESLLDYLWRVHGGNKAALGREFGVHGNNVKTILNDSVLIDDVLYRKAKNQRQVKS